MLSVFVNCKKPDSNNNIQENSDSINSENIKVEENLLVKFKYEDVARYAISTIMDQPVKNIDVRKSGEIYYVSYKRKSDSQKFDFKVIFSDNNIVWGNLDGRWRTDKFDEKLTFYENSDTLSILQKYSDGSKDFKQFILGD
jgi:hypothetical protein